MIAPVTVASSSEPDRLTKLWHINGGKPEKVHAGEMIEGQALRVDVPSPAAMVDLLSQLKSNCALIFGLTEEDTCPIVTAAELPTAAPGSIARTKDSFKWNAGPGWMQIDYDPRPGAVPLTCQQLLAQIFEVAPSLAKAPMVSGVSGSSHIYNAETGEQITGARGQRLYFLVADARDIPRAGRALFDRLWLAGDGYYVVSKSGQLLQRSPVDQSVWQTNRLDFAAPPVCVAPLECRRPDPVVYNEGAAPVDLTAAIPDLSSSDREKLATIKTVARKNEDLLIEQRATQEAWIDARQPADVEARHRLREAIEHHRLFGDFELIHSTGKKITVGEILDQPDSWHGERFHDPLEPDYSNSDKRIAWVNLRSGGPPYIYSHAHGGVKYRLLRPTEELRLVQGALPEALPTILERMKLDGEVFERAGVLVRLADDVLCEVEKPWLQTYLETAFRLCQFDARSKDWLAKDCPDKLAQRVLAARGSWGLPKVSGVVTYPVMRPDGSVIVKPGYDDATGLLFINTICAKSRLQPLADTLNRIWEPFAGFPFDSEFSRGVFLAALLTTACRPALPTAPAFLVRAFAPGTGKTLLSECLMLLVGARLSAMPLPTDNQEEIEKRLIAKLMTGCPGLILDNLSGMVDNPALCAILTSAEPEGRILGRSEVPRIINRALWVLNGNNVTAGGDTFRRILPITLDANCESPEVRKFSFNPKELLRDRLDDYRADLLSVLMAYQAAGAPAGGVGSMGSFEEWERLVRQCICWLIAQGVTPAPMADPLEVMKLSKVEDPYHQQHIAILEAWHALYGSRVVQVRDVVGLVIGGSTSNAAENAFREAVKEIAPTRGAFGGPYFAGWLRRHKGKVVGGLRLDPGEPGRKEPGWIVRRSN